MYLKMHLKKIQKKSCNRYSIEFIVNFIKLIVKFVKFLVRSIEFIVRFVKFIVEFIIRFIIEAHHRIKENRKNAPART
jgi:hypothetical protein